MTKIFSIIIALFIATIALGIFDIPEEYLPPTGEFTEWRKARAPNALDSTYFSIESVDVWVQVAKLSTWEKFNKPISAFSNILSVIVTAVVTQLILKRRKT